MKIMSIAALLLVLLVGCNSAEVASVQYELGDILATYDFAQTDSDGDGNDDWDSFGLEAASVFFGHLDEEYIATSLGGGYIWAQNRETYGDIVLEVTTNPVTFYGEANIYGVVCRAHPNNSNLGYYFLIRGDGSFGIRQGDGTRVKVLHPWTEHNAIKVGDVNTIRAVCIGDYFAMYINDKFVGEVTDDWLEEGRVAFAINSTEGIPIAISYDNLTIWNAEIQQ